MPCGSSGNANGCVVYRYSVYVLEAATSNRLTYFSPPLVSFMCSNLHRAWVCNLNNAGSGEGNVTLGEACMTRSVDRLARLQRPIATHSCLLAARRPKVAL